MRPSLFNHEEISVRADAARDMIDARLKLLPEGELRNFWGLVAQVYARPSTGSVPLAETAIVPMLPTCILHGRGLGCGISMRAPSS